MADNSSFRSSRSNTLPPRRDDAVSGDKHPASDPLAELARLIGQDETLRELTRTARNDATPERSPPAPEPHTPPWLARSAPQAPQWREEDEGHDPYAPPVGRAAAHAETHHDDRQDWRSAPAEHEHESYAGEHAYAADEPAALEHAAAQHGIDEQGAYYGDGQENPEDDYVEDRAQRRRGLLTLGAVLGVLVLGVGGAFGYWTWWSGPRGEPPLIKADTTPNKVVPATQNDGAGNKSIYDRFSEKSGTSEKMVSREEAPADIKSAPPRSVYPSAGGIYGPAPAQPAAAPPPSGVSANGAPRVVHTETIRPNLVASADIGQPVAPPLTAAATPPGPPPAPVAPAKQPAPRAKQASQSPAAQPTETPPAREAAPTGGYVVQLSSQKTEEEARASFKVLASKYAQVFGEREPYIKRVTIPEKGTFYRANVGPFATSTEANHFCSNLKIVGGQCIVQKN
jgi:hypothetical protein